MLQAYGLSRSFTTRKGPVEAVRDLTFEVGTGEVVGFLGPNGAGKTTTMRMLTTLLAPTAGTATVAGCDLMRDPRGVRLRIGYVAQGSATRLLTPVRDELVLQCRLHRMSRAEAGARAGELIRDLELTGLAQRPTVSLSGGQRRRLDLALGMVHRPAVLILDEPSAGLDPQSRITLWEQIRRLRRDYGTTVFLSTHYLDEADELCDRVLIIDRGEILAEDSPGHLKAQLGKDVVTVVTPELQAAKEILERHPDVRGVSVEDDTLRVSVESGERMLMELLRALDQSRIPVQAVRVAEPTLDDVFMSLTGRGAEPRSSSPAHA